MERNASAPVPPTREPQSGSRAAGGANRPSREEAEAAVRTLLAWTGDDPSREGLLETPKRVVDSYAEYFWGYDGDPVGELSRTFEDVEGYDDIVMLRDIDFASHCEHHMVPIIGVAHVAYIPDRRIVGISKLARVVDLYAKRLQTQETMTAQIADCIQGALKPKGVAVMMDALHQCMTMRGVHKKGTTTITTRFTGIFSEDKAERERFLQLVNGARVLTGR